MLEANKTDPKYMKNYRRNVGKEMGLTEAQLAETYNILKDKCESDRIYNYKLKDNIDKTGSL
jgi:hypothetical protein